MAQQNAWMALVISMSGAMGAFAQSSDRINTFAQGFDTEQRRIKENLIPADRREILKRESGPFRIKSTILKDKLSRLKSLPKGEARRNLTSADQNSRRLVFSLFQDVEFTLILDQVSTEHGRFLASGQIEDLPGSEVTLVVAEGVVEGKIETPAGNTYMLHHLKDGVHVAQEVDTRGLPVCSMP